jgi:DAK2 domain fusion protein YloV
MSAVSQTVVHTKRTKLFRQSPINGSALKQLVDAGLRWLRTNQQIVNSLNVFPVPDGDTGTNMVLTMQAAFDEIASSPEHNFGKMAHAVAHGALMGARGNSGVILSQLWRGFARSIDSQEELDAASMVKAFIAARDTAYKGVVRPVEGTILTVAKDLAAAAEKALTETDDPYSILERVVAAADLSVQHTPELLPVLKEAGVVDSGGKGLFFILEGMLRYTNGQPLDTALTTVQPLAAMNLENTLESIEPGQDYEVVVDFRPNHSLDLEGFYRDLEQIGTSIQVGEGDGIYRLHIHVPTEKRYEPIDYTMSLGTITKVAIENLLAQMDDIEAANQGSKLTLAPVEHGQIAVVAVSPGAGITRVFASLGVAAIVEGGQTMNPSTQEIISAFENLPTNDIILLPNNKNIIPAAEAAGELTVKNVKVIPSRTVPQGLAAMLRLAPNGDFNEVVEEMRAALDEVETGEITNATRNAEINGVTVLEGQIIALHNGNLVLAASSIEEACLSLLKKAHADHFELITLFYGADMSRQEVNRIVDIIRRAYPDQEVEVQEGGQPHYQFIISIE